MILLDIVWLAVAVCAFIYFDRRPEMLEPDGTTRHMTLREWIEADDFITEPVDEPNRRTNKKVIDTPLAKVTDINNSSYAETAKNKNTYKENLS